MERFEDVIESLNSPPSHDVSVLLDGLRKAHVGKRFADNINKLDEIHQEGVAERKRSEAALKDIVACYRRLEKNIPGMVYTQIIHADGRQTLPYVTAACRDLFDLEPQDLMKDASLAFELIHPDDRERRDQALKRMVETLQPGREILRHIVKGKTRWYDCIARPELQPNGDVLLDGIVLEITDRKLAEEELRENEERLRIANEAARIGTYAANLETDRVYWSPELCGILGVQPGAERTSEETYSIIHPDDQERALAVGRRALDPQGDGRFSSEHRIVRPDGQVRWVLWRGRTIFRETASGRIPSKRIGACVDITERKTMEEALQASEQKFATIFKASPPGFAITTLEDGRYLEVNSNECLMTGYSREELIGRSAFEMGFYENPEDGWRVRRLLIENGSVNNFSSKFRRKSGETRWGLFSACLIEFGGEKCLLSTVTDVTDLHRTQEALRLKEERLRLALDGTSDGIWDWNLQTGQVYFSPRYYTMMGYKPEEFPASYESWRRLTHPDDVQPTEKAVQQAIKNHSQYAVEFRLKAKNGDWRHILARGKVAESDSQGNAVRLAGSHTDITDRKRAEIALQESEQKYRALVESAQPIIFIVDENGVFRLSEGQGLIKLGLQPGQVVGQSVFEVHKNLAPVLDGIRAAMEGETNRRVCVIGDVIFETVFSPYFIANGRQNGVVGIAMDITERTRAEAASQKQKEKLALALQGADLGSWDWKVQTGEIDINERWAEMLGYQLEEIEPRMLAWEALVHPEDVVCMRAALNAHLEGKTPFYEAEHRMRHKSGSWVWVLDRGKIIERDAAGRPIRVAGTQLDISERKRTQQVLENRIVALTKPLDTVDGIAIDELFNLSDIQRLQDLFAKACGVSSFITTPDGTPITGPSNFTSLCTELIRNTEKGLTNCKRSDAIIGRYNSSGPNIQTCLSAGLCNAGACISIDGHHIANWLIGQVRNGTQDEGKMVRYAREIGADEAAFRVAFREVPIMSQEQFENVAQFLFALANQISNTAYQNIQQARFISERKLAEETLRKYERIVSTTHDQLALINRDYVYEAVNESLLKAHGKQREQIVGRTVAEVMGERLFRAQIRSRLDQALSGKTLNFQDSLDFSATGNRIMDVTYFPMFDKSGRVEGVVLNYRDITETRMMQKQLMQSQKIESIGILAGGVAHEINNPINGIMNYAQLIIDRSEKGSPATELAGEIIHETERISGIVRNLLTFARHEKQPYSLAHMADIVSSVLSLIRALIRLDQIDLQVDIEEGLPQIQCHGQEIQQVLMNLMMNARDALNERYPEYDSEKKSRIRVRLIERQDRKFIRTTVEDSGIGIRPSIRDKIFDPFFTTKLKGVGTGLGLSISYGIVKDHGGELIVESKPDLYTRFHMDLPIANGSIHSSQPIPSS